MLLDSRKLLNQSLHKLLFFSIPWGHHKLILDKVKGDSEKALYYINQVLENNWSRSMLLNWIDTVMTYYKDKVLEDMGNKLILPEKYIQK